MCTCAGFTPGGSLRKKRPSLSRPVPWCDVLGALEARRPLDFASLVLCASRRPDAGPGGRPATRHGKTFLVSTIPSSYRVVCAKQCCSAPISAVVPPTSLVWQCRTPTRQVRRSDQCTSPVQAVSSLEEVCRPRERDGTAVCPDLVRTAGGPAGCWRLGARMVMSKKCTRYTPNRTRGSRIKRRMCGARGAGQVRYEDIRTTASPLALDGKYGVET